MSALDHIRAISEGVLHDEWDTTPVAYDSVRFDSTAQDDFIRHTLLPGDSFQSGMPACVRYSGVVAVNVFTAQNKGTATAYAMADAINELFALKTIEGVRFYSGTVTRVGFAEDYFQLSIFINYQYDQIITSPAPAPPVPDPNAVTYLAAAVTHNAEAVTYGTV